MFLLAVNSENFVVAIVDTIVLMHAACRQCVVNFSSFCKLISNTWVIYIGILMVKLTLSRKFSWK